MAGWLHGRVFRHRAALAGARGVNVSVDLLDRRKSI
jgi:hypothetical protein